MILGVAVLSIFTNFSTGLEGFTSAALNYFRCEAPGTGNTTTCQDELDKVEDLVDIVPTTIGFVVLGFYPTFNLVYAINFKDLRDRLACMERQVEAAPHSNRPRSRENRVTAGNIQSAAPYAAMYVGRNGEPHQTSSFGAEYKRPSTFAPQPPTT
jgi:hypothetical protein